MKIYIGTSGFAHKEWKGTFYPEKLSPKELLRFYAERLNSVEINNTFYHMPNGSVLASWEEQVGNNFVFSFKAPQTITHIKRLRNVKSEMSYLFKALSVMHGKRGPLLFQFPKSFRVDRPLIETFLPLIPNGSPCAFDFRSATWLEEGIAELIREKGLGWCMEDTDESPVKEIVDTAPWGYLRLRRSEYTDADLSHWADTILSQKWDKAFVYFKHEGETGGAELAMRFQKMIDARVDKKSDKEVPISKAV